MTEAEFREAIHYGLGRGIAYARTNDPERFRDVILDACLHCYAMDPQCEGTRAPYMLELLNFTANPAFYYDRILRSLENCGDDWHCVQRFRLASYMAMDGDKDAKQAMYRHFNPGPRMAEQTAVDFVRMDGIDGLLFAAERVGALLRTDPNNVDEGYLLNYAVETFGEDQVLSALRSAAETSPNVAAYLATAEPHRAQMKDWRPRLGEIQALSYAELKPRLHELSRFETLRWGEQASLPDLHLAAVDLLQADTLAERIYVSLPFDSSHPAARPERKPSRYWTGTGRREITRSLCSGSSRRRIATFDTRLGSTFVLSASTILIRTLSVRCC